MKRIVVLIDSPDECADKVSEKLKKYLTKAGLQHMSEIIEVVEKE